MATGVPASVKAALIAKYFDTSAQVTAETSVAPPVPTILVPSAAEVTGAMAAIDSVPTSIQQAARGDGTTEQRRLLVLDLYARLQKADPASAAAAVGAYENNTNRKIELNRHIAGDWELINRTGQVAGSVSFDVAGNISSDFLSIEALSYPDNHTEPEILGKHDVVPKFSNLNDDRLTYETTHKVCGDYFTGELVIEILDRDRIEGELRASEDYDVNNRDPDYEPYGVDAEFTGRRIQAVVPSAKKQRT